MESIVNSPVIRMELIRELALHLDYQKFLRLDGIHSRVLREMAEVTAKLLSTICRSTWSTGEVPEDLMLASLIPIYKKSWKGDQQNYRPVCLGAWEGYIANHLE